MNNDRRCSLAGFKCLSYNMLSRLSENLNGYIIGTKGCCSIKTIGAGGYNIQCFHFRTLIHPYTPANHKVESKPQITADTNFKVMSIEELKDICTKLGAECKVYDNEAIYRMRLVMAIKKAI